MQKYHSHSGALEPPGLRDEDPDTHCPQCAAVADTYYRNTDGEIVGCEYCLRTVFWYEMNEKQEDEP